MDRISYMHFKDIDPKVKADVVANRTGFLQGLRPGHFLQAGLDGDVDFPKRVAPVAAGSAVSRAGARSSRTAIRLGTLPL